MARETTLVLVKPDGMSRGLAGEIVARLERRGLELRGARLLKIPKAMAREHYVPSDERENSWHPIVHEEMSKKDLETSEADTTPAYAWVNS